MWSKWYLIKTKAKPVIRRYRRENGKVKWERLPIDQYRDLDDDQILSLLNKLNTTYQIEKINAETRYRFDHAYINEISLEKFDHLIRASSTNKSHIQSVHTYLRKYVLDFFIHEKKLPDPKFWVDVESEWGIWLIDNLNSYHSIKQVIYIANRFLNMLSRQLYKELRLPKLEPLGKRRLAKLKSDTESKRFKFISNDKFQTIILKANDDVMAPIFLCYNFGLRISESLAINEDCLYEEYLKVEEQGERFKNGKLLTKTTKNYQERKVPYWYSTPEETFKILQKLKLMHPHTLIRRVNGFLKHYGYESHDLRRSFITRALRIDKRDILTVKDAAGHAEVDTTMGYLQRTEEKVDNKWRPRSSVG